MDPTTQTVTQETTFSLPPLPRLTEITQNFWRDLLGGVLGPQTGPANGGSDSGALPQVGDRPWS